MARDPQGALTALNRFGYGARGGAGDLASAASDPRGFVKAELGRPNGAMLEAPGLLSTPELAKVLYGYQADVRAQREVNARNAKSKDIEAGAAAAEKPLTNPSDAMAGVKPDARPDPIPGAAIPGNTTSGAAMSGTAMSPDPVAGQPPAAPPPPQQPLNIIQKTFRSEALARLQRATLAECGFVERLVAFWSNHFCISANKGEFNRILAGAFEREAIRPHVLGRFGNMLRAVEQHPAMILFLDNQQSMGTQSRAGQNRKKGLNENLAREIMELHTLGVGGGYAQADVTSLARIITGWTFAGREGRIGTPGTFVFFPNFHEPGPQTLLGKVYAQGDVTQGEAALADLAQHPSTAKFIATKFAHHFVADDPPLALVSKLETSFKKTDGDLRALATTLLEADEAWTAPLTKIRSPYEFLVAAGRMLARVPEDPQRYLGSLNLLGQPLWSPQGPNGFPDTNAAWAAPENIRLRLDIAAQIATRVGEATDPAGWLATFAGDAASPDTRTTIARAESRQQAFALLLMSPEFQRR